MVTAQYAHKAVTLKVDLFDVAVGLSESLPLEPSTSTPLYIGGIPGKCIFKIMSFSIIFVCTILLRKNSS